MKKLLFFFALCAFLLCGCSESSTNSSSGLQKSNFFAMDTSIEFNIYGKSIQYTLLSEIIIDNYSYIFFQFIDN